MTTITLTGQVTLGMLLQMFRQNAGIDQRDMGTRIGASRTTISAWERDEREPDVLSELVERRLDVVDRAGHALVLALVGAHAALQKVREHVDVLGDLAEGRNEYLDLFIGEFAHAGIVPARPPPGLPVGSAYG